MTIYPITWTLRASIGRLRFVALRYLFLRDRAIRMLPISAEAAPSATTSNVPNGQHSAHSNSSPQCVYNWINEQGDDEQGGEGREVLCAPLDQQLHGRSSLLK